MNNTHKIVCLSLVCMFGSMFTTKAQDLHYSQFYMTPLLINPAEAGAKNEVHGNINYRNQWSSVANPYATGNLSFDMRLGKDKTKGFSGLGINVTQDKSGFTPLKTFQLNVNYAYHARINDKSTFGGGLYAGFIQRSFSTDGIQWMNQFDGNAYNAALPSGEVSNSMNAFLPDVGVGLHYGFNKSEKYMTGNDHRKFYMGVSVSHLNRPSYGLFVNDQLFIKTTAYMNAELGIGNSDWSLVPGAIVSMQGPSVNLVAGTMLQCQLKGSSKYTGYVQGSSFSFGAYYRNSDALIASMLYKYESYAVGISYDINVSGLKGASNGRGGIEVSLRYTNPESFLYKKDHSRL